MKADINPDYVEKITDTEVVFRNYEGQQFRYPLTHTPRPAGNDGELSGVGAPSASLGLASSIFKD